MKVLFSMLLIALFATPSIACLGIFVRPLQSVRGGLQTDVEEAKKYYRAIKGTGAVWDQPLVRAPQQQGGGCIVPNTLSIEAQEIEYGEGTEKVLLINSNNQSMLLCDDHPDTRLLSLKEKEEAPKPQRFSDWNPNEFYAELAVVQYKTIYFMCPVDGKIYTKRIIGNSPKVKF